MTAPETLAEVYDGTWAADPTEVDNATYVNAFLEDLEEWVETAESPMLAYFKDKCYVHEPQTLRFSCTEPNICHT